MDNYAPKHLLFLGNGLFPTYPGGQERYLYELTQQLADKKDSIDLLVLGDIPNPPINSSISYTSLGSPDAPIWNRLWTVRKRFLEKPLAQLDAINLHFPLYSFPLLSHLPKDTPVTLTFHGPWALESQQEGAKQLNVWIQYCLERLVYQRCSRFIVLSKAFGNILHESYKVPWHKIHIIPGGVDINRFQLNFSRHVAREQLNWPQNRFILFTPRRLVQRMGIVNLLTALSRIKHRNNDFWLAIAGKGELLSKLKQQTLELGLENNVKFLGFLPDELLPLAYQAADLTVIPSQALEGFGLILLESLACGTPVVCTPVGGMPEVIEPFSPELIMESTEPKNISSKIISLIKGEQTLPSRASCREYVSENFNWSSITQRVRQVLLS